VRNGVVLIALVAASATLAGCGGSSDRAASDSARFEHPGFDITFSYPTALRTSELALGSTAGARQSAQAGIGIDRDNVIYVSRYDLRRPVTSANVAGVRGEVDGVIGKLAGKPIAGAPVAYGGFPGYRYRLSLGAPEGGVSRLYVLFDKKVEYFFNCQSTPETRDQIDRACDQALTTLHAR
jgi:hypothetical protein